MARFKMLNGERIPFTAEEEARKSDTSPIISQAPPSNMSSGGSSGGSGY